MFAGDHGVVDAGVTPWPAEVTRQMVGNFCAGGAAINAIARQVGAEVVVVDVGVDGDLDPAPNLLRRKVRHGTANIVEQPAMTRAGGVGGARRGRGGGPRAGGFGGPLPDHRRHGDREHDPVGRPDRLLHRASGVRRGGAGDRDRRCHVHAQDGRGRGGARPHRPHRGARRPAGRAGLPGWARDRRARRATSWAPAPPGYPSSSTASSPPPRSSRPPRCAPKSVGYCIAGHRSAEPGSRAALEFLGLRPLLRLDLRLGEGTGACLALPLVQAAARILNEMSTFDQAGVTGKDG